MYAVISYPRTGSRSLAKKYSTELGLNIGYLHRAKSVPSYCLSYNQLIKHDWILHAHWHTIHMLNTEYKKYIEKNYKIVHIQRNQEHIFLSALITMHTGNIDFTIDDIPEEINLKLVDEYVDRMKPTIQNMLDWRIDICYNFDDLYNNSSELNFKKNKSKVKNYNELYKRLKKLND
jgi:hypothetical protein